MRFDYHVLSVEVDGVVDALAVHTAYVAGGHDGVYLRVARSARLRDLEFLRDLPGLRYIEVLGPVVDDSAALLIPGVVEVCLLTRCKKALPELSGSTVSKLGLDRVPRLGLAWDGLCVPRRPTAPSTTRGGGNPPARVSRGSAALSTAGVRRTARRTGDSLTPLAEAHRLQHLWIIGNSRITGEATLDLADLAELPELTGLRICFGGAIATLAPLTGSIGRHLRDFRIRGTRVGDGDLSPLEVLHPAARVVGPDG
ncbi:hypothetical protein ACWEOO_38410 [Kribbella sp. NPDC004138]